MTIDEEQKIGRVTYHNPEIPQNETRPGQVVDLPYGFGPLPVTNLRIFYFDIDNCLYKRLTRIHDLMQEKIHDYFKSTLGLDDECANNLHLNYYKQYGLALEGLVRHHSVDALAYNLVVDDAIDLKLVLEYSEQLRVMLTEIRKHFDHLWLVTNAYKNHALRVISFLGIGDKFDGLTFCDYGRIPIICKPMKEYFYEALELTGEDYRDKKNMSRLWFVDDSEINVKAAQDLGFGHVVHFVEDENVYNTLKQDEVYYGEGKIVLINDILQLGNLVKTNEN